ncbi:MAG TPA: AGE family epimerase/isomerase [Rhizomicrobium sp.]|nr:AGE family epimerase/isomerase [Rhizomicrobium sp.]
MSSENDALAAWSRRFDNWLFDRAFPLWWEKGADHVHGGFIDTLNLDASPAETQRRGRVQARQSWVYGVAGEMGWTGPWRKGAVLGLDFLSAHHLRPDGQFSTKTSAAGTMLDATAFLYDQTFILLAFSQLHKVMRRDADWSAKALALLQAVTAARTHPQGGFVESGAEPFQSNPHMHLFEAALAWCEAGGGSAWHRLADELAELCLSRMIDPANGAIAEYYDAAWKPLPPGGVQHLEPGHQFEWAWLLGRWSRMRGHVGAEKAAKRLFEAGTRGVDPLRQVAIFEMSLDFQVTQPSARLWAQAERIKAAILLMETADGAERVRYREHAIAAAHALWRYLETPTAGLWHDRMTPDGNFIEEAAPASSFYHIICAISVLGQGSSNG